MEKHKSLLAAIAILIAVAAPLLSAIAAHKAQSRWPIVKFLIEPYDPRDLLYGHYMTFQVAWNWSKDTKTQACSGENCCLCVGQGDYNPEVSVSTCPPKGETLPGCSHIIQGSYYPGFAEEGQPPTHNFTTGVDRYYVDENIALPLERLFRDKKEEFAIGLGLSPAGKPVVEQLYVGKKTIRDYVASHGGKIPEPEPEPIQPVTP